MRTEWHISVARADVRSGQLTRHAGRRFEAGRAYALCGGLGLPRTWPFSTEAVLDGFEGGLAQTQGGEPTERLRSAVTQARSSLASRCDSLVERLLPDATLVGLVLAEGQLHVMSVGADRVYLQRGTRPNRLTARGSDQGGLLRSRPSVCSTPVEPGDLVLAGSVTAFSTTSIAKTVSVLSTEPSTSASVLASLLTEPAAQAGAGAVALVVRVL